MTVCVICVLGRSNCSILNEKLGRLREKLAVSSAGGVSDREDLENAITGFEKLLEEECKQRAAQGM